MLEALGRILEALADEAFVVACFDQYPFSLASQLLGINQIMLQLLDDRPLVEALMERCLEYGVAYGLPLETPASNLEALLRAPAQLP
ncbi:MAG: hypothetical protein A2V45_02270 [Candidatus Aminicenantes bacterium RBG_19FT_COMBO_58_17]|nr:MAG: hypothetical protein A2V45_02270 [Candidatus Aminicenantes bacterium RBG_19FT_COMBO_58_17]